MAISDQCSYPPSFFIIFVMRHPIKTLVDTQSSNRNANCNTYIKWLFAILIPVGCRFTIYIHNTICIHLFTKVFDTMYHQSPTYQAFIIQIGCNNFIHNILWHLTFENLHSFAVYEELNCKTAYVHIVMFLISF